MLLTYALYQRTTTNTALYAYKTVAYVYHCLAEVQSEGKEVLIKTCTHVHATFFLHVYMYVPNVF